MANWQWIVSNRQFETQGELSNLHEGRVDVNLNKVRTAQVQIRLDNTLAPYLATATNLEPVYLRALRNGAMMFHGPVMTVEEAYTDDQKATLQINCAGPEIILASRRAGRTAEGVKFAAGVQRAIRFKELLNESNLRAHGETHIDYTSGPIESPAALGAYEAPPFKTLAEILQEMYALAEEGFDWLVYPQEQLASKIGRLEIKPTLGEQKPASVFEWGGGKNNIGTFSKKADLTNMINLGWNISSAGPEATGAPTITKEDGVFEGIWGLREDMISANVLSEAMRSKLTEESVTVRKRPRQTITFTPVIDDGTGKVPVFAADYNVGDQVRARILYEGSVHFDEWARVWGISLSTDEQQRETQTLTLSEAA